MRAPTGGACPRVRTRTGGALTGGARPRVRKPSRCERRQEERTPTGVGSRTPKGASADANGCESSENRRQRAPTGATAHGWSADRCDRPRVERRRVRPPTGEARFRVRAPTGASTCAEGRARRRDDNLTGAKAEKTDGSDRPRVRAPTGAPAHGWECASATGHPTSHRVTPTSTYACSKRTVLACNV